MKRPGTYALILIAVLGAAPVRADALKDSLASIPADAMGFIAVPNVAQLDKDYQQAIKSLGLEAMVPPPMNSLVGMVKMYAPMLAGMDENGPLLVVIMPAASLPELQMTQAIVLSAKDPKAVIDALGGKPGEGDLYTVSFFGTPSTATISKNKVIIAMSADVAKKVAASTTGIDTKLAANELKMLAGLDLIVWLDAQRLIALARPLIDTMVLPMLTMGAPTTGFGATSAEMNKKSAVLFLDGAATLTVGLGLDNSGVGLRFGSTTKPGSELAKRTDVKPTAEPLLRGLPACDFLMTVGQVVSTKAIQAATDDLKSLIVMAGDAAKIDKEKVAKFEKIVLDLVTMISSARATAEGLAPGPDGFLGFSMLLETTDSGKWIALSKEAVEVVRQVVADSAKGENAERAKETGRFLDALTYGGSTEKIAGVEVSHLKLDIDKIAKDQDADEDDIENAKKILGKDGLLVRVAPVDGKQVLLTLGGGEPRTAVYIEAAKSSGAPLAATPGIKKVSAFLPKEKGMEMYFAVDNIVRTVQNIQKAVDEEVLPIQVPPINAPVGMAMTGGEGWAQYDVFVPTDLMVAVKNATMSMMGGGPPPAGESAEAEKE